MELHSAALLASLLTVAIFLFGWRRSTQKESKEAQQATAIGGIEISRSPTQVAGKESDTRREKSAAAESNKSWKNDHFMNDDHSLKNSPEKARLIQQLRLIVMRDNKQNTETNHGDGSRMLRSSSRDDRYDKVNMHVRDAEAKRDVQKDTKKDKIESICFHDLHRDLKSSGETLESMLRRFLKARNWDVEKAYRMLRDDWRWRREEDITALADEHGEAVLGCRIADIWEWSPAWSQGSDTQGRPVLYKRWGNFNFKRIKQHTTLHRFVRYHTWCNENMVRKLEHRSRALGRPVTQFTCIFDAAGFTPRCMLHGALHMLTLISSIDQNHYPERLGIIVVINAPWSVAMVWDFVRKYLNQATRDKVHIIQHEKDWRTVIDGLVAKDQLVDLFGGDAPLQLPSGLPTPAPATLAAASAPIAEAAQMHGCPSEASRGGRKSTRAALGAVASVSAGVATSAATKVARKSPHQEAESRSPTGVADVPFANCCKGARNRRRKETPSSNWKRPNRGKAMSFWSFRSTKRADVGIASFKK